MTTSPQVLAPALLAELRQQLGERMSTDPEVLRRHGRDESPYPSAAPQAVCFPTSTEAVRQVLLACGRHRTPVIPFGQGTSVEGHVLALHGGVCLSLEKMDRILEIHPDDQDAVVQAGVRRKQLAAALEPHKLFFSVDPGADASLGGMAATGASGTNAVAYGTMADNVLSLRAVLADGTVVRTGGRARKSSAGYDLTHLLVGSEGTLGVITELTLRLRPCPEAISAAVCAFPDIQSAVTMVVRTLRDGVPLGRIELLDTAAMQAVNAYAGLDLVEQPTLFFELAGGEREVADRARSLEGRAEACGGSRFRWSTDEAQRARLWQARYDAYYAALALRPGCRAVSTDVCVPISALPDCIATAQEAAEEVSFPVLLVGHVGDGNFHLILAIDPEQPEEVEAARRLHRRIVRRALELQGTCTGEHGIGIGKLDLLEEELGEAGISVLRRLKQALDPHGLLNPGKVLRA